MGFEGFDGEELSVIYHALEAQCRRLESTEISGLQPFSKVKRFMKRMDLCEALREACKGQLLIVANQDNKKLREMICDEAMWIMETENFQF